MPSRDVVEAFAKRLETGDFIGAIEQFYAPEAATYENNAAPTIGRDQLVAKERGVLAASREVKAVRIGPSLIDGDHVATRWTFSFTNAEGITRTLDEIAWQTWRGMNSSRNAFITTPSSWDAEPLTVSTRPASRPAGTTSLRPKAGSTVLRSWASGAASPLCSCGRTPAPKRRRSNQLYWAKPTVPASVLTTGGGFHFPVSASDFGL
jgi:hypothetical protein